MTILLFLITPPDIFTPENILKFAEHLYLEGDYQSALNEYRRYIFLSDSLKEDVHEKIIDCLINLKRFAEALKETEKLKDTTEMNYTKGLVYLLSGRYASAREFLMKVLSIAGFDTKRLVGLSYAYEYNFKEAGKYIDLPRPFPSYKSIALGGTLSLFPGGGNFYCGRIDDGIYSLLVVGTAGLVSYFYYHNKEDLKFKIALGTASLFYLGNIYGGINAVRNYNYYQNEKYLRRIIEENP